MVRAAELLCNTCDVWKDIGGSLMVTLLWLFLQVHLAMVRYHEAGRFCERDEPWDQDSAFFHLERAALCGELEAIVAVGQCYLQLPHHILPDMTVEVGTHTHTRPWGAVLFQQKR